MQIMKHLWKEFPNEIRQWRYEKKQLLYGILLGLFICWLFYDRIFLIMFMAPFLFPWMKYQRKKKFKKQRENLRKDFREMMLLISNGLSVGYSMENALKMACAELKHQQQQDESLLVKELEMLTTSLKVNEPVDKRLLVMADRIQLEELAQFAEIVSIVRRNGGNLIEIIGKSADHLNQTMQIKEEIDTMTAAKRMEKKIMSIMPYGILLYVRLATPGYFENLYESIPGILLSTVSLALLAVANVWAERVVAIEA
ncbi:type II secretion system F family protein [Anaerostipes sp. MSJ-23]|uniref:type II secretion system F family protein n=1 Tax=Anaerostipes sp. MSJ-23 TaxID=2841520 RepID=UPI001C0FC0D2|nr:type II secretion system F family protein [Anaerostipes sp. MSJ-23]MBU5459921.1 type II secretion system F family protein [Anaerostipes sp. MSJ-23]